MSDSPFPGFPRGCVSFYEELRENNEREWFEANKARYERDVLDPARAFVSAMGSRLQAIAPEIVADARSNRSIFRIYRDTRFSKDKTPYKTHLGLWMWEGGRQRMECSGFYFHLEPPTLMLGVGVYMFSKPMLEAYREAVDDEAMGEDLTAVVEQVGAAGARVGGDTFKRVPRGFPKDHPRADLLRHGGLHAGVEGPIPHAMFGPELVDWCFERYAALAPLHTWLGRMLARVEA